MITGHYLEMEFKPAPQVVGTQGAGLRWLTDMNTAETFFMRHVIVEVGGSIGLHDHPYEHQIFIIRGTGTCRVDGCEYDLREGTFALVPGSVVHAFKNTGATPLEFICCINRVEGI